MLVGSLQLSFNQRRLVTVGCVDHGPGDASGKHCARGRSDQVVPKRNPGAARDPKGIATNNQVHQRILYANSPEAADPRGQQQNRAVTCVPVVSRGLHLARGTTNGDDTWTLQSPEKRIRTAAPPWLFTDLLGEIKPHLLDLHLESRGRSRLYRLSITGSLSIPARASSS